MSIISKISIKTIAASCLLVTGIAGFSFQPNSVEADTVKLRSANIFPETYVQSGVTLKKWASMVEEKSDGEITIEIVHGGALLGIKDHVDGIASGLVDLVTFFPIYFPGEFKVEGALTNILDIWSEKTPALSDVATIHTQLHEEFDVFQAEYDNRNMMMLVPLPVDPYTIACTKPVKSLADLKGRKMRTFGRYFPILQEHMGVEPIKVAGSEAYGALSTGLIDCIYTTPSFTYSNKFYEVAPYVFVPAPDKARPQMLATGVIAMNKDSFAKLSKKNQDVIKKASKAMVPVVGEIMQGVYDKALKQLAEASGNPVTYMSKNDFETWKKNTPNLIDQAGKDLTEAGYPGAKIIARYRELSKQYSK